MGNKLGKVRRIWYYVFMVEVNLSDLMEEYKVEPKVYGIEKAIEKMMNKNEIPSEMYYYTNFEAFYNIIINRELWLGNTASMNDKKEMLEFIENLKTSLEEYFRNQESYLKIIDDLFRSITIKYPHAMCFSEKEDDASLWDRYANNAKGVCIQIDAFNFLKLLNYSSGYIRKIAYERPPEEHIIFKKIIQYATDDTTEWGSKDKDKEYIIDQILLIANMRKHISFDSEHEIRYSTIWGKPLNNSKIEYKQINGTIREIDILNLNEYFKKQEMDFKDIFKKIIIGPKSNQSEEELKLFLCSQDQIEISKRIYASKCPLR